jgi:RNA polymerase sigma-70 factor (ECF subfamily)
MSTESAGNRPEDMMGVMAERLGTNLQALPDTRDFGSWVTSEQKRVFLLCRRMLQDAEDADSATQDTFLKAWQALNRPESKELDDPGKWLTRIAVNTCLDRLRSRRWQFWRKRPSSEDETAILALARAKYPNAEDEVFANQIGERLERALTKLSLRQRAAFTLRHYEDRSLAEIAEVLDLDIGTVKVHLFRALQKLREELHDLYFRERKNK